MVNSRMKAVSNQNSWETDKATDPLCVCVDVSDAILKGAIQEVDTPSDWGSSWTKS